MLIYISVHRQYSLRGRRLCPPGIDDSLIDPVLQAEGANLAGIIAGATTDTLTEAAEDEAFNRITNADSVTEPGVGSAQQVLSLNPLWEIPDSQPLPTPSSNPSHISISSALPPSSSYDDPYSQE